MKTALNHFAGYPCLIFPASRLLEKDADKIETGLGEFLQHWESHGTAVEGGFVILEDRFVVVAHRPQEISGCGRDDLLVAMNEIGKEIGVEWLGASHIFYRNADGKPIDVDRLEFKKRSQAGEVTPETIVFDTTIRETNPILEGKFALPASQSWHLRLMGPVLKAV